MAATPKKKSTRSRTGQRRAKNTLIFPNLYACPSCGKLKLSHIVCPHCGSTKLTTGGSTKATKRA